VGEPASSVAKMPGWPSVGTLLTDWKPASRRNFMVSSQPSFMPRFSAAMLGWRIHSWRRWTDSSWRFSISLLMATRSSAARTERVRFGKESAAAPTRPEAAAAWRNVRRSTGFWGCDFSMESWDVEDSWLDMVLPGFFGARPLAVRFEWREGTPGRERGQRWNRSTLADHMLRTWGAACCAPTRTTLAMN